MLGHTNLDSGIIASDMDLTLAAIVIMGAWVVGIAAAGLVMVLRPGGVAVRLAPAGGAGVPPHGPRGGVLLGGGPQEAGDGRRRGEGVHPRPGRRAVPS